MKKLILTLLISIATFFSFGQTRYRIDFRTDMYRYVGTNSLEALRNMKTIYQYDKTNVSGCIDMFDETIWITYYDEQDIKRSTSISIPNSQITDYSESSNKIDIEYNNGKVHVEVDGSSVIISKAVGSIRYVWWGTVK